MGKCLVTRLSGTVNNDNLLRIGEFAIKVAKVDSPTDATQCISVGIINAKSKARIIGSGYFTDKTLSENKGNEIELITGRNNLYVSKNTDVVCVIENKYNINILESFAPGQTTPNYAKNKSFSLDDLKFSPYLKMVNFSNSDIQGSISSFDGFTNLEIVSISNTNVKGNLSALRSSTNLRYLSLSGTNIEGNLSAISGLTNLTNLSIQNCNGITGNLSGIKALTKLKEIYLNRNIGGDLATISPACYFIGIIEQTYDWTTRDSSANIFAIECSNARVKNVDKMLIDFANCNAAIPSQAVRYKTIYVKGTRTSASDDAVATLQQKGYTVGIAKA